MSMWFWFFEARHSPNTAPFTLWINGGPGTSSMEGVFQENGPCHVNADGETTVLNPYSWNNLSNSTLIVSPPSSFPQCLTFTLVIYIDQPIGTGFSYGTIDVNSTFAAAPVVWTAFQVLFESKEFAKFQSREFIFATESYGGHWGPGFMTYFDEQNTKIRSGTLKGEQIHISALMINNGWFDPPIQNQAFVEFATFAPGYGQLQSDEVLAQLNQSFFGPGGCKEQENACSAAGDSPESNGICARADAYCTENVFGLAVGDRNPLDLRQSASSPDPFPPEFYVNFLHNATTVERIGAKTQFTEVSIPVELQFNSTGEDARSLLPMLSALANSKLRILVWAGDADINCNWLGVHNAVLAMDWYGKDTLHNTPFKNMTIGGKPVAAIQNVDNFSFAYVQLKLSDTKCPPFNLKSH
ncbi:hypothetical protein BN946_scf184787.g9 [Trametes cinnabarina]|uniref:Carboxypeptidase n=1 Tax=Pycnoporus cinnabarinus TaxID=5643 RepID=A0A060SSN1_PYCCI|nr:hypothetical protein BN946_scf184787.g9 [Trametes cinnabarina]